MTPSAALEGTVGVDLDHESRRHQGDGEVSASACTGERTYAPGGQDGRPGMRLLGQLQMRAQRPLLVGGEGCGASGDGQAAGGVGEAEDEPTGVGEGPVTAPTMASAVAPLSQAPVSGRYGYPGP